MLKLHFLVITAAVLSLLLRQERAGWRDDDSGVDCGEKVVVGKVDP